MTLLSDIGPQLVAARHAAGLTQAELGRRLGVAQPQVARWEAAAYRNVTLERVGAVAEALDVHLGEQPLLAAEPTAAYETALPGAHAEALHALARTRTSPAALAAFARTHGVERLEFFGSVLRPDFTPGSDVDVLVTYAPGATPTLLDLAEHETELSGLLRRRVDLISRRGIERSQNTIRRESILTSARTIYARP